MGLGDVEAKTVASGAEVVALAVALVDTGMATAAVCVECAPGALT